MAGSLLKPSEAMMLFIFADPPVPDFVIVVYISENKPV